MATRGPLGVATMSEAVKRVAPTVRPNGSLYRPRLPLRVVTTGWNDDGYVVLVYGTHDPDRARDLALSEWAAEMDGPLPEPRPLWTKEVPWDALGLGFDRTILEVSGDTKGSTPTLRYGYHESAQEAPNE